MKTAQDGRVSLSALSERENVALAVILAAPVGQTLEQSFGTGELEGIALSSDIWLTGGPYVNRTHGHGRTKFLLDMSLPDPDGGGPLNTLLGISNMDYTPQP